MGNLRILIVEDSKLDAELEKEILIDSGISNQYIGVINAIAQLEESILSGKYDIIVSDYDLTSFTILDVLAELRRLKSDLPIVCVSGAIGEQRAVSLIKEGVNGYLLKNEIARLPQVVEQIYKEFQIKNEKERMQDAIIKNEKKYRSLFDNLSVGVMAHKLIYDAKNKHIDYVITEANIKAAEILGMPRKSLLGKSAKEIYNDNQAPYLDIYAKVAKTGESYHFQTFYEKMQKHFDINAYSNETGTFITIFQDITDSMNVEMQVRNLQRLETIENLASGVAHEINNPINGIMNYCQIILDTIDASAEIKEYAKVMMHESKRIAKTTRDLLKFSRYSSEVWECVNCNDMLGEITSLISATMRTDEIEFHSKFDTDITITCIPQQVQQIVMNLLINARHAVMERSKENNLTGKVSITSEKIKRDGEARVLITVEDNGIGIPKQVQDRIYNPFFTTKGRDIGTGLGLSISLKMAQKHKGALYFETKENAYTKFHLELPVEHAGRL